MNQRTSEWIHLSEEELETNPISNQRQSPGCSLGKDWPDSCLDSVSHESHHHHPWRWWGGSLGLEELWLGYRTCEHKRLCGFWESPFLSWLSLHIYKTWNSKQNWKTMLTFYLNYLSPVVKGKIENHLCCVIQKPLTCGYWVFEMCSCTSSISSYWLIS